MEKLENYEQIKKIYVLPWICGHIWTTYSRKWRLDD